MPNDPDASAPVILLDSVDGVTAQLARGILEEAGIPSMMKGPDFDVAELGRVAHDSIRGTSLLVPAMALERARALLDEAWGKQGD